jgi:hypothetical protein
VNRIGDALDLPRAEVLEREIDLVPGLLID